MECVQISPYQLTDLVINSKLVLLLQRNEEQECDFGETLPPSWNSLDDVYTLQYRKGNLNSVYIFKALKLGRKLAIYFMVSKLHEIARKMSVIGS